MREYKVPPAYDQKRTDTFLFEMMPNISASVIFKAFRKRSIKVNEKRVKESYLLSKGDTVQVYIPDEYLNTGEKSANAAGLAPSPDIIYEDACLLVVSKPQGMPVHQDKNEEGLILDQYVQKFIRLRDPITYENGFPALCHRLDRNTGGLVVFAKDPATLTVMEDKFRLHEVKKSYLCLVYGVPEEKSRELTGFLQKDSKKSQVYIRDYHVKGSERIVTRYKVIKDFGEYSLLEVELITGKTHQIRAHLAHIGHPLLGDGKYGINAVNRALRLKWQALWSVRLLFDFNPPSGHLAYLSGRKVALREIPWEEGIKGILNAYTHPPLNIE